MSSMSPICSLLRSPHSNLLPASPLDHKKLVPVKETPLNTTLCLASAHALVLLDDGIVGDPMEKTTLEALDWKVSKGERNLSFLLPHFHA